MHCWSSEKSRPKKPEPRKVYVSKLKAAQEEIRVRFEKRDSDSTRMLSLEESRQGIDPKLDRSAQPTWDGPLSSIVEENPSTEVIASYIDWSPFFWTWEFKGKFPTIFEHRDYGQEARKLYEDAL